MRYPKRTQYMYAKSRYRVRNWAQYEAGLQMRGALTVWLSDTALEAWRAPASGRPGGQRTYSDLAIEAALTIRMVFHLPLRQTEGFLLSLADLLEVELPIPDHATLSRRLKELGDINFRRPSTDRPIHLLIDSTGLRIHVAHLRKPPKRRVWRKLHVAVNADTGEVLSVELTNPIQGAQPYSSRSPGQWERNRNIRSVRKLGRKEWYTSSGYSRRSLVENAVFRYKSILGQRMRSRSLDNQRVEVRLACKILNSMTRLGMPDSVKVG